MNKPEATAKVMPMALIAKVFGVSRFIGRTPLRKQITSAMPLSTNTSVQVKCVHTRGNKTLQTQ